MSTRYPRRARLTTSDTVGLRTGRGSSGDAEAIHTTSPRTPGNRLFVLADPGPLPVWGPRACAAPRRGCAEELSPSGASAKWGQGDGHRVRR